jgi:hypothetical protein
MTCVCVVCCEQGSLDRKLLHLAVEVIKFEIIRLQQQQVK